MQKQMSLTFKYLCTNVPHATHFNFFVSNVGASRVEGSVGKDEGLSASRGFEETPEVGGRVEVSGRLVGAGGRVEVGGRVVGAGG